MILTIELPAAEKFALYVCLDGEWLEKIAYIDESIKKYPYTREGLRFEFEGEFEVVRDELGLGTIKAK